MGENQKKTTDEYRKGWDLIFGKQKTPVQPKDKLEKKDDE